MIHGEILYKVRKIPPKMKLNSKHYSKFYTALTFISLQTVRDAVAITRCFSGGVEGGG